MTRRPWTPSLLVLGLCVNAADAQVRLVGELPDRPDAPVLVVPAPHPRAVADLRTVGLRALASMRDQAGAFGIDAAFALDQRRRQMGEAVQGADLGALTQGLPQGMGERLTQAHRAWLQEAFGGVDPDRYLFRISDLVSAVESAGLGHQADHQGASPFHDLADTRAEALGAFLARVASAREVAAEARARGAGAAPSQGIMTPGPDTPGFDGLAGGPSAAPAPSSGPQAAIAALTRWLLGASGGARQRLAGALQAASSQGGAFASLSGPDRGWVAALAEALLDGQAGARVTILATPAETVLVVVDLNLADEAILRAAGLSADAARQVLARRGSIQSLSQVRGLIGDPVLQASQARLADWSSAAAPTLAQATLEAVDDRDPYARQASPLDPSALRQRLGRLASEGALQGPGNGYWVQLEELPYPLYVKVSGGRVVAMTPAPRNAEGVAVASTPGGQAVDQRAPMSLDIGRYTVLEPEGQNSYRVLAEGDPQRRALDSAFQVPYVDHDVDLIALHRRALLDRPGPRNGVPEAVRRQVLGGTLLVVLHEGSSIHSVASAMRIRLPDGAYVSLQWAPQLVVPLRNAALFAQQRDGDLPMLLTHELAHIAMLDHWQGAQTTLRLQPRNHGNTADRYLSGRLNAAVEGWAEAWAILMARDRAVQQAFPGTRRIQYHLEVDAGDWVAWQGTKVLDGHSLMAHEYAVANGMADALATPEFTRPEGQDLAALLPRGARVEGGQVVLPGGAAAFRLGPGDLARLRGLQGFAPPLTGVDSWLANLARVDAARGRKAAAMVLAAMRFQPLASVGHADLGPQATRQMSEAAFRQAAAPVLAGQVPPGGPWPRVGPELFVYATQGGLEDKHRAVDLNRYDDPNLARVLGLSAAEHQALVTFRERNPPARTLQEAASILPPRLHAALTSARQEYQRRFPGIR